MKKAAEQILSVFIIIVIFAVIKETGNSIFPAVKEFFRHKSWRLMIYSHDDLSQPLVNSIDGYKSKKDCMEKGVELIRNDQYFMCGYDCKFNTLNSDKNIPFLCEYYCGNYNCLDL